MIDPALGLALRKRVSPAPKKHTKNQTPRRKNRGAAVASNNRNNSNSKPKTAMGPVPRSPRNMEIVLRATGLLQSSSGGVIAANMTNNPSTSAEFSACASLYDSYRVERMTFEYVPFQTYNGTINYPPLAVVFDPDTITVPSSLTACIGYDSLRIMDLTKHWSFSVRPPRVSSAAAFTGAYTVYEDGFVDCATPVSESAILWFAASASNSLTYGTYIFHWTVRFNTRH